MPPAEHSSPVVVHVMEAFAGGTERHLIDLVRHVVGFKHVIAIPQSHHGRSTAAAAWEAERAGGSVVWLGMDRSRRMHRNVMAVAALRRVLGRQRVDLVHGHSSIGGAVARLAAAPTGIPVLYTPNGLSRAGWAVRVERRLRPLTTRLIAVSGSEARFAAEQRVAAPEQIVEIPNGIELEPPAPLEPPLRARLGLSLEVPLVGCIGRLAWQKAPEVFVRACAEVARADDRVHFVLIGDGPLRDEVDRELTAAGIGRRFHRLPVLASAAAAIKELDVYVLPSRFEGYPYTPMEAMRAGTPVIVTAADGNRDVVQDGVNGIVVPVDDVTAVAWAAGQVLTDRALRDRLTAGGRATLPRLDVRRMGAATGEVYREVLAATVR